MSFQIEKLDHPFEKVQISNFELTFFLKKNIIFALMEGRGG